MHDRDDSLQSIEHCPSYCAPLIKITLFVKTDSIVASPATTSGPWTTSVHGLRSSVYTHGPPGGTHLQDLNRARCTNQIRNWGESDFVFSGQREHSTQLNSAAYAESGWVKGKLLSHRLKTWRHSIEHPLSKT